MLREVPPTAGLPLKFTDLFNFREDDLESGLSRFLSVEDVLLESSGTAALVVAFEYLKTRSPRRTAIVPGYSCPLVAIAAAQAGLRVRLCDVQKDNLNFDWGELERACDDDALVLVATHFGGIPCDIDRTKEIAKDKGVFVIEDAAQSMGARIRGNYVGTLSDIGMFSLSVGKGLTIYQGGFLYTGNPEMRTGLRDTSRQLNKTDLLSEFVKSSELVGYSLLYNRVGLRLTYGSTLRYWLKRGEPAKAVGDEFPLYVDMYKVGGFRKSVGLAALDRLHGHIRKNIKRGRQRATVLSKLDGLQIMAEPADCEASWPFITVLFNTETLCQTVIERLWKSGLGVTKLFVSALSDYEYLRPIIGDQAVPNAQSFARRSLTITNSEMLTDDEFAYVANVIGDESGKVSNQPALQA